MTEPNEKPPRKTSIPRQKMATQDPSVRKGNFDEVPLGLTPEQAITEASRCLNCKNPRCVAGCPVSIAIADFISLIAQGKFLEAAGKIKEQNVLPSICGRVCPQEDQCEKVCILGARHKPVSIGALERFVADYERQSGKMALPSQKPPSGKKVAIVGSGPACLAAAGDLIKLGYGVTVFEALHEAGGVLTYGIPEFRLPKSIVQTEIQTLKALGVKFQMNMLIGRTLTIDELLTQEGFDAVFIGTGAGLPQFMGIPGENLAGVYSANEYLTRVNLMKAYQFPRVDTPVIRGHRIATVGGGNVAVDAARTALRLGSEKSSLIYRRSREEMPARREEIEHAEEEGIDFHFLAAPVELLGDERGRVRAMRCQKMTLGEPDASGRRKPVPLSGSEFELETDVVIVAIGTSPNPLMAATTPDLGFQSWGGIVVDPETGRTNKKHVYAGGDIVTGSATVILAMGAGRKAAQAIHQELSGAIASKTEAPDCL